MSAQERRPARINVKRYKQRVVDNRAEPRVAGTSRLLQPCERAIGLPTKCIYSRYPGRAGIAVLAYQRAESALGFGLFFRSIKYERLPVEP